MLVVCFRRFPLPIPLICHVFPLRIDFSALFPSHPLYLPRLDTGTGYVLHSYFLCGPLPVLISQSLLQNISVSCGH